MTTARDVARRAGTSPAVVSYVFNDGPRGVAPGTRARVLAAAAELGYEPRVRERKPTRSGEVVTIGLVVPALRNPVHAEVVRSVGDAAAAIGAVLLVAESRRSAAQEERVVQSLVEHRVDGLLVVALAEEPRLEPALRRGIPVAELLGPPRLDQEWPGVSVDHAGAARAATAHLLSHGYESIGLLDHPAAPAAHAHRQGFDQAVAEHPGRVRTLHWRSETTHRASADLAAEILRRPDRPRALYCTSALQANLVSRIAHRLGLAIPTELAVIGLEAGPDAEVGRSQLTAIDEPLEELGVRAVELITRRSPSPSPPRVVLPAELVIRRSCGCGGPVSSPAPRSLR